MLEEAKNLRTTSQALPFIRLSYGQSTRYMWSDDAGIAHTIYQADGGEQGDPMMPLLFCLGIRRALSEVAAKLRPEEEPAAYLDDIYAVCEPNRVADIFGFLEEALQRHAGISLNLGKTRCWNSAGVPPPRVEELGHEAWSPGGIVILGTPVGTPEFVDAKLQERLQKT
jgi:hypothetical protein